LRNNHQVSRDGAKVELILSPQGGIVRGRVLDGQGQAVANAVVAMRPEPPASDRIDRSHTYRTERTDQNGVFEVRGTVPGDYRLFAWYLGDVRKQASFSSNDPIGRHSSAFESVIVEGAFRSREFMRPFESFGKSVRVGKGDSVTVEVRIIDHPVTNP
jgi:hypothetical protein